MANTTTPAGNNVRDSARNDVRDILPDPDYVRIFDTTLRDGEQSPGCTMNVEEKLAIARQLERLGVDIIEAGFAASSPGDFESVNRIADTVRRPTVVSLSRTREATNRMRASCSARAWKFRPQVLRPRGSATTPAAPEDLSRGQPPRGTLRTVPPTLFVQ